MTTRSCAQLIDQHRFAADDSLLIDANVWVFLYGPQRNPKDSRTAMYSACFKKVLASNSRIFIDVLIVSEFINRYARMVQAATPIWKSANAKEFRNSPDFRPFARDIADACRRILGNCQATESGFTSVDVPSLLGKYEAGGSDFNDLILTDLCATNGWTLVTDDADFKVANISILTANRKLLGP
jgi:predicted nucleic acid-binding protein